MLDFFGFDPFAGVDLWAAPIADAAAYSYDPALFTNMFDAASGLAIDPYGGGLIDPATGGIVDAAAQFGGGGYAFDPSGYYIDPASGVGYYIDPLGGGLIDPATGAIVNPDAQFGGVTDPFANTPFDTTMTAAPPADITGAGASSSVASAVMKALGLTGQAGLQTALRLAAAGVTAALASKAAGGDKAAQQQIRSAMGPGTALNQQAGAALAGMGRWPGYNYQDFLRANQPAIQSVSDFNMAQTKAKAAGAGNYGSGNQLAALNDMNQRNFWNMYNQEHTNVLNDYVTNANTQLSIMGNTMPYATATNQALANQATAGGNQAAIWNNAINSGINSLASGLQQYQNNQQMANIYGQMAAGQDPTAVLAQYYQNQVG